MNFEDVGAAFEVWQSELDFSVESTGSAESRIENEKVVESIRGW